MENLFLMVLEAIKAFRWKKGINCLAWAVTLR